MLLSAAEFRFGLSRVPTPLPAMSHTTCRHARGFVRRGGGAALRCRHGSADRWGTPGKVPVGFCRQPGPGRVHRGSVRRVWVPPTRQRLLLAAVPDLGWRLWLLLQQR